MAREGTRLLALEIVAYWSDRCPEKPLTVCVPGGTCTTAMMLHRKISDYQQRVDPSLDIRVAVVPCVGSSGYARRQMESLNAQIGGRPGDIPAVIEASPDGSARYVAFGTPEKEVLDTFSLLRDEHELVVDLLYGAPAWTVLLRHMETQISADLAFDAANPIAGREMMYVHSGGLEGVGSQLLRYKHKNLIDMSDVQLPGRSR